MYVNVYGIGDAVSTESDYYWNSGVYSVYYVCDSAGETCTAVVVEVVYSYESESGC